MLVNDSVLANDVEKVDVTCAPIAACTGNPVSITVKITETPDKATGTSFTYSLTAAFRKLVGGGGPITPPAPQSLILFGDGGCAINITGGAVLTVYGQAFIDAVDTSTCTAVDVNRGGVFDAGSTGILQGGTCSGTGSSVCPPWTNYPTPKGDPYAGLAVPPTQPIRTNACNGTYGSATTLAGEYKTPFVVQGSVNCTLASGIYVFDAGFSITAGATLTSAPGGVLIYVKGGRFNIDGAGNVTLAAMTTGSYVGLVVWQAASNTTTFNLAAGGVAVFGGAIYVPHATVYISGDALGTKATSIVAQNIVMDGSAHMTIGASAVALSITAPATLPAWTINRPYPSTTLTAAGGDGGYTWSQTGLPNGMALNANTGAISGTPTVAGTAAVTITLNDALGDDPATRGYALKINGAPAITTASPLPAGKVSAAYSTTIATTGGTAAFAWTASSLPAGLTFNNSTGVISGTPTAAGTSSITVALTDAAGATVSKSGLTLVISPGSAPAPTISSVTLSNGSETSGMVDKGDTIEIVFSAPMSVSSICSAWTNDAADQSLTANGDVEVTLNDGGGSRSDTISVTSNSCTLNFGLLDLGAGYVKKGSPVFSGNGSDKSTVTWTASTRVLLIRLGSEGGKGSVSKVSSSAPVYTSGPMLSSAGGALSNSPFTLPNGRQF